jgi:hypothetical protein
MTLFTDSRKHDSIELLFHLIHVAPEYSDSFAKILNEVKFVNNG